MFSLFWFGVKQLSTWKYSLIKTKLQLQNNKPNIYIKNKNYLKYLCYYSIKSLFNYREWVKSYKKEGLPCLQQLVQRWQQQQRGWH